MAILLLLGYAAICVLIFKILRVQVNKWTVTTGAIGGVVLVGGLLLTMNYNHPFTTDARLYFFTTPIVPQVKGRVVEVPVKANVPLKKGDALFKIDPQPYQFLVDGKTAALEEAKQSVKELKAAHDQATAVVERAKAQFAWFSKHTTERQNSFKSEWSLRQRSTLRRAISTPENSRSPKPRQPSSERSSPTLRRSVGSTRR